MQRPKHDILINKPYICKHCKCDCNTLIFCEICNELRFLDDEKNI